MTAAPPLHAGYGNKPSPPSWSERYGKRHQLVRVLDFPPGVVAPKKVRVYYRCDHYILQWWDPDAKANLSDSVAGDLVTAIARARQIDERLLHFRSSGQGYHRSLGHQELVEKFLDGLRRRADAGEISPGTVERYTSALNHYQDFTKQPSIAKVFPLPARINREFQLTFAAFLNNCQISSNGHPHTPKRLMKASLFVLQTVRAMYEWATDPDRGCLLPEGFHNPFLRTKGNPRVPIADLAGEPDITTAMAVDFLAACDSYQLPLFALLIFYGLRAAEPCFLFREYLEGDWLKVPCNPELCYLSKGRRDKRFPLIPCVQSLLQTSPSGKGLLFRRRNLEESRKQLSLYSASLQELVQEFQQRCARVRHLDSAQKIGLRDQLLQDAGAMTYDHVETEFRIIAKTLAWPKTATLKDFRHLFSTCLENAGMPEHYRKYLMGQSPGKAAINTYTHLNQIRQHFERAMEKEFQPLMDAVAHRAQTLARSA